MISFMKVGDFSRNGELKIAVIAHHEPSFPCALIILRASDKEVLGEYWHAGYIHAMGSKNLDGDSVTMLLLGGENNALDKAFVAVVDPGKIGGYGPTTESFKPV